MLSASVIPFFSPFMVPEMRAQDATRDLRQDHPPVLYEQRQIEIEIITFYYSSNNSKNEKRRRRRRVLNAHQYELWLFVIVA